MGTHSRVVCTQTCGYALHCGLYTVMRVGTLEWSVYRCVGTHPGVVCTQTCGDALRSGLYTDMRVWYALRSGLYTVMRVRTPEWSVHSQVGRHSRVVYTHREVCVEKLCPYTDLSGRRFFTQMGYIIPHPSHPSRSSHGGSLGSLCYTATSHQVSILHMIVYIC